MHTDIALGDGAEQRVGQRMQAHIGIAMADQLLGMRDADAAQDHRIAGAEGMHVIARGNADRGGCRPRRQA